MIANHTGLRIQPSYLLTMVVVSALLVFAFPKATMAQNEEFASGNSWVVDQIKAGSAWSQTKGNDVTVAVLDTGIMEHPFFEGKDVLPGHDVSGASEDGTAYSPVADHGTQVAGGVLAIAPDATIMPVLVWNSLSEDNEISANPQREADAIRYAVDNGADIINFSITGSPSEVVTEALQYAIDKGVVVVAGAGNDPGSEVGAPANVAGVVAVAGAGKDGRPWKDSTVGPEIAVAAPAADRTCLVGQPQEEVSWAPDSSKSDELYEDCEGTSLAAANVSGVAALVKAANPKLTGNDIVQRLISTASGDGTRDSELGYGIVDAEAAVNSDISGIEENPLGYPLGGPGESGSNAPEGSAEEGKQDEQASADAEDANSFATSFLPWAFGGVVLLAVAAVVIVVVVRKRTQSTGLL
ncbi:S8 family serine peptidase [Salininema proteolyticum]|uniref:S8 family serine peptidase n=1 Tax=Salininema proteolyticum TaxID=1607685 RepID=A0ABV8U3R4_9ACTN